jgi:hypothetical protein
MQLNMITGFEQMTACKIPTEILVLVLGTIDNDNMIPETTFLFYIMSFVEKQISPSEVNRRTVPNKH